MIIIFVEKVSTALDKGKFVVDIYLDIKKAFDTVSHFILLDKLDILIAIREKIYCLIQSCLESRSQYVCYNNTNLKICGIWCAPMIYTLATISYIIHE